MSIYDRKGRERSDGSVRHTETTFVGGCGPISKGPMQLLQHNAYRQWVHDGEPDRDVDPSNPYWALQTYKTYICCRTVAELERVIEAAYWSSWKSARYNTRPKTVSQYTLYYNQKRQARALSRVHEKLELVRDHIKRLQEEHGATPIGVDPDGNCQGFRPITTNSQADEAEAALMTLDFMGGFDG